MAKWMIYNKKGEFSEIGKQMKIDPVLAKIMINRDITSQEQMQEYLHPGREYLADGEKMKDMAKAVSLLKKTIYQGKKIRIIGDYDIDGIEATYILHQGLLRCGGKVSYQLPHRVEDGYGINTTMIERCLEDGVELVVTCDNGIAASEAVLAAKESGIQVIITDHHQVPFIETEGEYKECLPPADAIVNPQQKDCAYPYKNICGAVVAWKVIQQLYREMEIPRQEADCFLENVAFATVGDVMTLTGENRSIVAMGLKQLQNTKNPGMQMLIKKCGIEGKKIQAYHVGFVLGPCLNASGRLDSATKALQLLEAEDIGHAAILAEELLVLNEERKAMTEEGVKCAVNIVGSKINDEDTVLVIYLPKTHESIAGIIAGRMRERYEKPVFVLTDGENGQIKGSGRSVEGFSMYQEMCQCKELFTRFGGHPMASGLSMPRENLELFIRAINDNTKVRKEDMVSVVHIDVALPFSYLNEDFIGQLELLEPFGNGNPKPVFAQKGVTFLNIRKIGKQGQYLKVMARGTDGATVEALYFGEKQELFYQQDSHSILYYPQINTFGNRNQVQIVISDIDG